MTNWASDGGGMDETGTDNRVSLGFERETVTVPIDAIVSARLGTSTPNARATATRSSSSARITASTAGVIPFP